MSNDQAGGQSDELSRDENLQPRESKTAAGEVSQTSPVSSGEEPTIEESREPKKEEPVAVPVVDHVGVLNINIPTQFASIKNHMSSGDTIDPDSPKTRPGTSSRDSEGLMGWTHTWAAGNSSGLPKITDEHEIVLCEHELKENRVLGLVSASREVLTGTVATILKLEHWQGHDRLELVRDDEGVTARLLAYQRFSASGETVLVVRAKKYESFTESLIGDCGSGYKLDLRQQGTTIIVLFGPGLDQLVERFSAHFSCRPLPFLMPLLEAYRPKAEASALAEALEKQRKAGFWGTLSDADFCREIRSLLHQYGELEEKIKTLGSTGLRKVKAAERDNFDYLRELFDSGTALDRVVAFTATFFPRLGPDDFDRVLRLLVGEAEIEVAVQKKILTKKGKTKVVDVSESRRLIDLWEERPDQYLANAELMTYPSEEGRESVAFENERLRERMHAFVHRRYAIYLRQNFAKIREEALLFAPDISVDLVECLVRLWVEMVESDRNRLGDHWLVDVARSLSAGFHFSVPEGTDPDEVKRIAAERARKLAAYHHLVFRRVSALIREMLKRPALRDLVRNSLNHLLRMPGEWASLSALQLVLGVAKKLRFAPEFRAIYWLKRVMDESRDEGQLAAYRALLNDLNQAGGRLYEVLDEVYQWLPATERSLDRFSPSNGYGLRLLIDYGMTTALSFSIENWGAWPPKYALFRNFAESEASETGKIPRLIEWIFHEGQSIALGAEEIAWHKRADLLELWWGILLGPEGKSKADSRLDLARKLLSESLLRTTLTGQRQMLEQWRINRLSYEELYESLGLERGAESQEMWLRRTLSVQLEIEFNLLRKQQSSAAKGVSP